MTTTQQKQQYDLKKITSQVVALQREVDRLKGMLKGMSEEDPINTLLADTCEAFDMPVSMFFSESRRASIVSARVAFLNIAKHLLGYAQNDLARYVNFNHATVDHHTKPRTLEYRIKGYGRDAPAILKLLNKYDFDNYFKTTDFVTA